jgi:hypothetical protein
MVTDNVPSTVSNVCSFEVSLVKFRVELLFFLVQEFDFTFDMLELYFVFCVNSCWRGAGDSNLCIVWLETFAWGCILRQNI